MNMPGESSQQPTRETATGGASRAVLEYGWASPPAADSFSSNLPPSLRGRDSRRSIALEGFPRAICAHLIFVRSFL
jgi:hypothetical protein